MNIHCIRLTPVYRKNLIKFQRKFAILCLTVILLIFLHTQPWPRHLMKIYYWFHPEEGVACHGLKSEDTLPDISDFHPKKGRSIFFHETSCKSYLNGKIVIKARQACAVESAARLNPDHEVYLLYASPGSFKNGNTESDRILNTLINYPNVKILHVNLERYLQGTVLEPLWTSGKMRYSQYSQPHTSDVLRYLTLWKYGGIYLDLDVIVIKPLSELGSNYAGAESDKDVAAGVLSFSDLPPGHELAEMCVNDLADNFRGDDWGWNGPGTVTRLLSKLCNGELKNFTCKHCRGFTAYPASEFYAIPWEKWKDFCSPDALQTVLNLTRNSHVIHVWNKFSSSCKIPLTSTAPYLYFAKKFCPKVVDELDEYF